MLDASFVLSCGSVTAAVMGGPNSLGRRPAMARFKARDRRIFIAALNPAWMKRLCAVIEAPELTTDPRFASAPELQENARQFIDAVNKKLATRDAVEWEAMLVSAGIPAGASRDLAEIAMSEQVKGRGLLHEVESENGTVTVVGSSFPIGGSSRGPRSGVPRLGEHTDDVLREIGLSV